MLNPILSSGERLLGSEPKISGGSTTPVLYPSSRSGAKKISKKGQRSGSDAGFLTAPLSSSPGLSHSHGADSEEGMFFLYHFYILLSFIPLTFVFPKKLFVKDLVLYDGSPDVPRPKSSTTGPRSKKHKILLLMKLLWLLLL